MIINKNTVAIDKELDRYTQICKEIGKVDEKIAGYRTDIYLRTLQRINTSALQYSLERLKNRRAELENRKMRVESAIYREFNDYHSSKKVEDTKSKSKFRLERFQEICIQYGYQQAVCELKLDSNTKALLHSARIMNAEKKSLSTAIEDD